MTHSLTRRDFTVGGTAVACLIGVPFRSGAGPQSLTLAEAGRARGIEVGSAIRSNPRPEVAAIIARECALITPENALKPATVAPVAGSFVWDAAQRTYDFAHAQGLRVHGHALFWYKHPLDWARSATTLASAVDLYGDYFATVMQRFPQTVSWDVFNEIVGTNALFRPTFPIAEFGVDFVERMLRRARDTSPQARLVINENGLECGDADCRAKRAQTLRLLRALRDRDAPLDAIALQGHLSSRDTPSESETVAFIAEAEALGLDVYISEMDVDDVDLDRNVRRRDLQVAEIYHAFLTAVLKSQAVKRVVFWGMTDAENWIANDATKGQRDGFRARPALFDRSFDRKPAYYAVRDALNAAPAR